MSTLLTTDTDQRSPFIDSLELTDFQKKGLSLFHGKMASSPQPPEKKKQQQQRLSAVCRFLSHSFYNFFGSTFSVV